MLQLSFDSVVLQFALLGGGFNYVVELQAQHTYLDDNFLILLRSLRLFGMAAFGRTGESPKFLKRAKMLNKTQKAFVNNARLCEAPLGPGRRSAERPSSVHRLRPGDIDVIGAMGDSLTAGTAVFASSINHLIIENRGVTFPIGGRGKWTQYMTLPNLIKEYNPNLYGYPTRDSLTIERHSKFNVAEPAAMIRDLPYMATILVKRMRHDRRVNMTHDWKLITIFMGANDVCSEFCYADADKLLQNFERAMVRTYRYLRDNVPRLLVNVIKLPNLLFLTKYKKLPDHCRLLLPVECPCLAGLANVPKLPRMARILKQWWAKDREIVERPEFNTETFAISYHTFLDFDEFFKRPDGGSDLRLLTVDCFHLSQRGQALAAQYLWNSMFEPLYNKSNLAGESADEISDYPLRCPTVEQPYFLTPSNTAEATLDIN